MNSNLVKLNYFFNNQLRNNILSGNEGCVISRNNEDLDLDVIMGVPSFKNDTLLKK